jgi:hypothetical protein
VPLRLELRVGYAFLAASAVAVLVLLIAMRLRLQHPLTPAPEALAPEPADRKDSPWT